MPDESVEDRVHVIVVPNGDLTYITIYTDDGAIAVSEEEADQLAADLYRALVRTTYYGDPDAQF